MSSIDRPTSEALKGALILLIVLGHNTILTEQVPRLFGWLYTFHVLCFMMLPWLYGTVPSTMRGLGRRLRKTYVPYTFFYLLLYAIYNFAFTRRGFDGRLFVGAYLLGGNGLLKESCGFQYLWFLPAYFFMMCFRNLFGGLRGKIRILFGVAVVLFSFLWCAYTHSSIGFFELPAVGQGIYAAAYGLLFLTITPPLFHGLRYV